MALSQNLPVFESELVDGGLQVNVSNISGDVVTLIGFAAVSGASARADAYASQTFNQPIRINRGDEAELVYGLASDNSTITQAIYETVGAGATSVFAFNLGQWGQATYVDPVTETSYPLFTGPVSGVYSIDKANYYMALDNAYTLLRNFNTDIIVPVDAYAFDAVSPSGLAGYPTNFAYQLADACYDMSTQNNEVIGIINVEPAPVGTLYGVQQYIGTSPVYNTVDGTITGAVIGNGDLAVVTNGTGLLGVGYMAGASGNTVLPGFFEANFDVNAAYATLPPRASTEVLLDRKNNRVNIGRYLSIAAEEPIYSNGAFTSNGGPSTYTGLGATAYAGLVSTLVPHSAPTNKPVAGISGLRYTKSLAQLDQVTGRGYVTFRSTNRGLLVTDAPTAAVTSFIASDYRRLQVMRIVNAVMKMVRLIADPFIGEPNSDGMRNSLNTAISAQLKNFVKTGALRTFDFKVVASDTDRVLGVMNIELTLVPEFEVRKIKAVVSLKPNL